MLVFTLCLGLTYIAGKALIYFLSWVNNSSVFLACLLTVGPQTSCWRNLTFVLCYLLLHYPPHTRYHCSPLCWVSAVYQEALPIYCRSIAEQLENNFSNMWQNKLLHRRGLMELSAKGINNWRDMDLLISLNRGLMS